MRQQLVFLLALALAVGFLMTASSAHAQAGCCQLDGFCVNTDNATKCDKCGGGHYQLGVCDENGMCQATAPGGITPHVAPAFSATPDFSHPVRTAAAAAPGTAATAATSQPGIRSLLCWLFGVSPTPAAFDFAWPEAAPSLDQTAEAAAPAPATLPETLATRR